MKKCLTFMALACVGMMTATVSAQDTLQGTLVLATTANTVVVSDGTSPLDSGWTVAQSTTVLGTGFNHSLAPQEIVTTLATGLNPGDVYNIAGVYTNLGFFTNDNLAFGHASGALTDVPGSHADVVDGTLGVFGSPNAYDLNIGEQEVASDGTLSLFIDDAAGSASASFFLGYKGGTFDFVRAATSVPEPSSLAVLGLMGGLGMLRRRR